jgi:hypothetical protein
MARIEVSSIRNKCRAVFASAVEIYGGYDPRSLGIGRIGLGLLLLHNVWRRVPGLVTFYTNDGILPNHSVLWRPTFEYMFSFFLAASRAEEAAVMFSICAAVFLVFTAGYRTRLFHVLSFACLVSLQSRQAFTMNGGDVALCVLTAWTMFLPMGARFSLDAVLSSLRARKEVVVGELNDRAAFTPSENRARASLAFFAILLELSVIYYFNAVNKHGWTWRRGLAVHYVLYQERMVTWFGSLIRDHVSVSMSRALSYGVLGLEFAAPFLLLTPVGTRKARRIASILLPLMHLGFASCLNVGQFSFNMIGFFPLLMSAQDWDWFEKRLAPAASRARTVYVPEASTVGFAWARLLSRLDLFGRLRFAAGPRWEVEDPQAHARASGAAAVAACIAALPCGRLFAALLGAPGVRTLAEWTFRTFARRAETLDCWMSAWQARRARPSPEPSPARLWFRRHPLAFLREGAAALLIFACTNQLLVQNWAIPQRFKPAQPKWVTQLIWYARLDQGWQMFSPDVPTSERHMYVDAVTFGGRHVDPFNEAGSRVALAPIERIPTHLQQNEFWYDYEREIFGTEVYWRALKEWIFKYHERTGNPEDRIISFEAKILEHDGPPPGETEYVNPRTKVMFAARE